MVKQMGMEKSLRKAAIALQNLPKPQAAKVMGRMQPQDLRSVFSAIDSLDHTTARQIFDALDELARDAERLQRYRGTSPASPPHARTDDEVKLLREAFRDSPFAFLINIKSSLVNELLRDEHPRNIALVLANLPSEIASEQVKQLEPVLRISVVKRICQIDASDSEDEARELAFALKLRLQKLLGANAPKPEGVSIAARLLNLADEELRSEVLTNLAQSHPELETRLNESFVSFDQIAELSDHDIRVLLRSTDTSYWAPALKHAPPSIHDKIARSMHERVAQVLDSEIQALGPVPPSASKMAQQHILGVCFNLVKSKAITGPSTRSR